MAIKAKLLPRWPADVSATAPIVATKANGAVALSYNSSTLPQVSSPTGAGRVVVREGTVYNEVPALNIAFPTIANNNLVGNVSGSTAAPAAITGTQANAVLPAFTGDTGSGGVKGLVPAPSAGDAAAGRFLKADGTFAVPSGAVSSVAGRTGAVTLDGTDVSFTQSGTGATTRNATLKMRDIVSVRDFGATGDGSTDDKAAIQKAIDYCKTFSGTGVLPTLTFAGNGSAKSFRITGPLNFTGIRTFDFIVDGCGNNIFAETSGAPVFDALDSWHISFRNFNIYGAAGGVAPTYGIQIGRAITGNDASYCSLQNVTFTGTYTKACFLNAGSEIFKADKCNFWNNSAAATAACVIIDSKNATGVSSTFFTATIAANTQQSHNDNLYVNCTFEQIGGAGESGGPAVYMTSQTRAHHFLNCYAQNQNTRVLELGPSDYQSLVWDVHCEPTNVVDNIRALTNLGNVKMQNCVIKEYYQFATNATIATKAGAYGLECVSCDIEVAGDAGTGKVFAKGAGTTITYQGRIAIGANGNLYDFSPLNSIQGTLEIENVKGGLTLPTTSNVRVTSNDSFQTEHWGVQRFNEIFCLRNGTNIASAATITIPTNGSYFYVTGTTNINAINIDANHVGRIITLTFAGVLTLNNSIAGKTLLASSFTTAANSTIMLRFDGSYWTEICRTNLVPA